MEISVAAFVDVAPRTDCAEAEMFDNNSIAFNI